MRIREMPKRKPWWSEMHLQPIAKIRNMKLARGHADILKAAGYI
jgi:hypothetical protein